MNKFRISILAALYAALLAQLPTTAVAASEFRPLGAPQTSFFTYEAGARFWYGWGKTAKDLYGTSASDLVSRLTYQDYTIQAVEGYFRADHTSGWFLKGYVGGGAIASGRLNDEDFPSPGFSPYSSTNSSLKGSTFGYASVDLGYNVIRGGDFNIGAFVGYHYLNEKVSAYGCSQIATNPMVCAGGIPETIRVISQTNNWNSLRLGLGANVELFERLKLSVEGAWLPYVSLYGSDTHWLRIGTDFTSSIPEDGKGWGYQFEGLVSYRFNDVLSVGVGGRYWHMQTDRGHTHFENHIVGGGGFAQELRWSADNYGVFVQGSIKLGPYPSEVF